MADPELRPSVVEFHRSPPRYWKLAVVLFAGAALLAGYAAFTGEPWWQVFVRFGLIGVGVGVGTRWAVRREARLPLRLTDRALELTGPDGTTLAIDWTNLARARVQGRLDRRLVVEPVDPQLTRPPMRPNQWAASGQRRPYALTVRLDRMTPGIDRLRDELARRLPPTAS
ncbi:hypothetical protein ACFY3U_04395 [Micromonospora sp. NPDC000089]|uniref:hypothetical protein n=1 Tax=unclassified Micromonospora TaxID=2617518 RepID=UPI00367E3DD5